jgi:hypothetical protein
MANPTGIPKKNKTRRRMIIPKIPVRVKLKLHPPHVQLKISTNPLRRP